MSELLGDSKRLNTHLLILPSILQIDHALHRPFGFLGHQRVDHDFLFHLQQAVEIFGSVMRFMCGHRLQGLMNSTPGACS